jgi:hypothetical protein
MSWFNVLQVQLATESAIICQSMGFVRKFAFFVGKAAALYCELSQWQHALELLRLVLPIFQLDFSLVR